MKTVYRYIKFERTESMGLVIWQCRNSRHDDLLGKCQWDIQWHQFVFFPTSQWCVFSADCLDDISHFLKQLNEANKR